MPPKAKSGTTFSKSITNSASPSETPIQFVKGVGPKLGLLFASREIETVRDLLHFFPRTYEDRSQVLKVANLTDGTQATLALEVISRRQIPIQRRSLLEVRCRDETGQMSLKWFYAPRGMEERFSPGAQFMATGKVKIYMGRPEIVHPEITWGAMAEVPHSNVGRVVPVYSELDGIPSRTFRRVLWEANEKYSASLAEDLPDYLLERWKLPRFSTSVRALHFPPEAVEYHLGALENADTPAHHRLIYGEFFKFEFLMLRKRLEVQRVTAMPFGGSGGRERIALLRQKLPFQLTNGQDQALSDILQDFGADSLSVTLSPMNRLIQGDVGAGKTAVAFLSAACVVAEGGQVALMAPTEILAEQHFRNALHFFGSDLPVALLTGKTTSAERTLLQRDLQAGKPLLVIGTHALLEDAVVFSRLCFVMIDEQHRFGVEQRKTLRQKGIHKDPVTGKDLHPHHLILTATPIPRTLALSAFGDLAVTSIRELPPGRSPIQTKTAATALEKSQAYQKIKDEITAGRQASFIYPLVNESEAEGFTQLKSAVAQAEHLAKNVFPEFSVGLLHGQMNSESKAEVMAQFKKGQIQILVSTTVVEVGVDVPNATVMAIEHAERFGLSQLHQLRGRVGRGKFQSYCFLFSHPGTGGTSSQRLSVLENTNDGFQIAEADLEIRGPGEFLGTRQAGGLAFRMANLVRDREWLLRARDDAMEVIREDPDLREPKNACLRSYFLREGRVEFGRLGTA